eukprot:TRINITY_DN3903_c0_g1_i1.p1 TRINITY_DN3903_c0_g1~~TRINITY_DN3903_c0_g1_i1.p1  ORF type:complete len:351 (-),score=112.76 TRINITY_DN3903_c0_g1_i1:3-1055(-)
MEEESPSSRKRLKKGQDENQNEEERESFIPNFLLESIVKDTQDKISVFQLENLENGEEEVVSFRLLASNFSPLSVHSDSSSSLPLWNISTKELKENEENMKNSSLHSSFSLNQFLNSSSSSPSIHFLSSLFSFRNGKGERNFIYGNGLGSSLEKITANFKGIPFQNKFFVSIHFKTEKEDKYGKIEGIKSNQNVGNILNSSTVSLEEAKEKKKAGHNMTLRTFFDSAPLWMASAEIMDENTLIYHHLNAAFAKVLLKDRAGEDPVRQCMGKTSRDLGLQDIQIRFWVDNMRKSKGVEHFTFEIVDPSINGPSSMGRHFTDPNLNWFSTRSKDRIRIVLYYAFLGHISTRY